MTRLSVALFGASIVAACSAPGSLFSLDGRELAIPATRVDALEARALVPPGVETPRVTAAVTTGRAPLAASTPRTKDPPATASTGATAAAVETEGAPSETTPASPEEPDPDVLVATSKQTLIYARPSFKSPKLGYLRSGAVVHRSAHAVGYEGCRGGFYEVAPEGYVCAGNNAALDAKSELARAVPRHADRTAPMPYEYGAAAGPGAPLYARIPTLDDERAAEPGLGGRRGIAPTFDGLGFDEIPWFLARGGASISTSGSRFSGNRAVLGNAIAKSAFAFVSLFESGGRRFGLTADMAVVPLDRLTHVVPSRFHGLPLGEAS
ncbi:MAG TPA: hypothetical protein VHU80_21870, partial [Polyangiaceae bacterium]|nr:hypothetical protein [Polyangiaceae bacterium]